MTTSALTRSAQVAAIGVSAVVAIELEEELQRPVTWYLLVNGGNLPGATVASVAGCSKQNVSKAIRRIEDMRAESAPLDDMLTRLEKRLFGQW